MKLVVVEWMSLDGVVRAPGAPDEDRSGGFAHGGWHLRWVDDTSRQWVVDNLNAASAFLFGRVTYENFAAHWPHVSGPERVVADPLNSGDLPGSPSGRRLPRYRQTCLPGASWVIRKPTPNRNGV